MLGSSKPRQRICIAILRWDTKRLDTPPLGWTAAVVRDGGHVFDRLDGHAGGLQGGDRAFATGTRPLHQHFQFFHAVLRRLLSRLLTGTLTGKRRALAAAFEAAGA